jgi:hypothetical protein
MITCKDVLAEGSTWEISLSRLTGKRVKDIRGYLADDFGVGYPSFKLTCIIFEDGTAVDVEGEHDFPYLSPTKMEMPPNFDEETLRRLYLEENAGDAVDNTEG